MDKFNPITQIDFMQAHIETLKEQLAEKEAMIDWLTSMQNWDIDEDSPTRCPQFRQPPNDCTIVNHNCATCWYEAAKKAVKKG